MVRWELGIARCGLACCLCSENTSCPGCLEDGGVDKEWCENRRCSLEKGIDHCYECPETECQKGLLGNSVKARGFTAFCREYGEPALIECLKHNAKNGIVYHRLGHDGDYDDFDDVEVLIQWLQSEK